MKLLGPRGNHNAKQPQNLSQCKWQNVHLRKVNNDDGNISTNGFHKFAIYPCDLFLGCFYQSLKQSNVVHMQVNNLFVPKCNEKQNL